MLRFMIEKNGFGDDEMTEKYLPYHFKHAAVLLLSLTMVLVCVLPSAFAEGPGWRIEDRTLIIDGYGEMQDFDGDVAPWRKVENGQQEINAIEVRSGITHVGQQAFQMCRKARSAVIADSVRTIGDAAFYGCEALRSVTLPQGLYEIGVSVFDHCESIKNIVIPEGVETIRNAAFNCCSKMEWVYLPRSLEEIEDSGFNGCYALRDVYYGGSEEEWNRIEIASYNRSLHEAYIHYNSQAPVASVDNDGKVSSENGLNGSNVTYVDAKVIRNNRGSEEFGLVCLKSDGTVETCGFSASLTDFFASWQDVKEIVQGSGLIIGLQNDGTILIASLESEMRDSRPADMSYAASWTNIKQIGISSQHIFGLREDGRLMVAGPSWFNAETNVDFSNWAGIKKIAAGSTSMGDYIVGLKDDGSVLMRGVNYRVFYGMSWKIKDISCSGYILLCLREDNTVSCTGADATRDVTKWRNIVQVFAGDGLSLGLTNDGRLRACITYTLDGDMPFAEEIESWKNIRSIYLTKTNFCLAVNEAGHVKTAHATNVYTADEQEAQKVISETTKLWKNVDRILYADEQHVLALTRDGTLLSCGLDLP